MCDITRADSSHCPPKSGKVAQHLRVTGSLPFYNDHTRTAPPARRSARQAKSSLEERLRSKKYSSEPTLPRNQTPAMTT